MYYIYNLINIGQMNKAFINLFYVLIVLITIDQALAQVKSEQTIYVGDCTLEEAGITKSQYEELLNVYKNPFVLHLRTALNNYLNNSTVGINKLAIDGLDEMDCLNNYDKTYFQSPFTVMTFSNHKGGGKVITILFKEKPDKIFDVWVYKLSDGEYELRSFTKNQIIFSEINELINKYHCYIKDKRLEL